MRIELIKKEKWRFYPLLLLADESCELITTYLDRGELYALYDPDLRGVLVLTDEGQGIYEIQSVAVWEAYRRRGYGRALLEHAKQRSAGRAKTLLVGTGDSPRTLGFYQSCGFTISHRVKNHMLTHYKHPIIEDGVQLFDKVYLSMQVEEHLDYQQGTA